MATHRWRMIRSDAVSHSQSDECVCFFVLAVAVVVVVVVVVVIQWLYRSGR